MLFAARADIFLFSIDSRLDLGFANLLANGHHELCVYE
jgi:hypothetical protein